MKEIDKSDNIQRYETRLKEYGYDPQTLGWGKHSKQEVRFSVLGSLALALPKSSVLDIGCGFANLFAFLKLNGWKGNYTGVDIVPGLINEAKKNNPDLKLLIGDITNNEFSLDKHDFVIASGVMNTALPSGENEFHIKNMLEHMFKLANKAVCADFMTTNVDFQQPGSWHTDPCWVLKEALAITPRVSLRNDYMPYEFSLFLYKEIEVSERRVFEKYEEIIPDFNI